MSQPSPQSVITVTLNPTIDRIIEVPGFRVGGHLRGRLRSRLPAGKAFNVSRALAALGVPSTAMGWVGQDAAKAFEEAADRAGLATRFTPIGGPTRENITITDPEGSGETHIRDTGPMVTDDDVRRLSGELATRADENALFVFTGSCAPGLAPDRFGDLLDTCIGAGARVVVDGSGEALRVAAAKPLWMIKPNLQELADLVGRNLQNDHAIVAAARDLSESISIVVVTLGSRGAWCFAGGTELRGRVPLAADRIRSTVGCGDAILAGFLADSRSQEGTIDSALSAGLAVAAASAMNEKPAVFDPGDVRLLRDQVELVAVK